MSRIIDDQTYQHLMTYLGEQSIKSTLVLYSKLMQAQKIGEPGKVIKELKPVKGAENVSD